MSQFYLTLPSNTTNTTRAERPKRTVLPIDTEGFPEDRQANQSAYTFDTSLTSPGQSLNNYRVRLPQRIQLQGDWEVGLVEVTYPHTWFNFNKGDAVMRLTTRQKNSGGETKPVHVMCEIFPNQYSDADQLVAALNYNYISALEEHQLYDTLSEETAAKLKLSFIYQKELRRVVIKVAHPELIDELFMSPHLLYVLGFEAPPVFLNDAGAFVEKRIAKYPVDLRAGLYAMYIYCDLVANQIVGDSLVPLLRTVTVEGKHEDVVCKIFNTPHYLPVSRKEFDSIEISINDDQSKPIMFQFGKVIVKLHFRRQKPERY